MEVLIYSEISDLALDRSLANVATDAPVTAAVLARYINEAWADIWEISGGRLKSASGSTLWGDTHLDTTGIATGTATTIEINEVLHLFASTDTASLGIAIDTELVRRELSYLHWLRSSSGLGSYGKPKVYALTRLASTTPATVNKLRLDYWPSVAGYYFPAHYVPQFTPLDAATVTTPDCDDLFSRDIGLLAAARLAQALGNQELVPGIVADFSDRTTKALDHKLSALLDAKQDQ